MSNQKYWLSIIFPISAISSGFSVIIPLYILELHGNVIDVSLAATAYSLAVIPSSLFWGELTQRLKKIRMFISISVISIIPIVLLLYTLHSILIAISLYAVYAFVITASSPAINVLIMNKRKKTILRSYYGVYGLLSIVGNIIGYFPGVLLFTNVISRYLLILFSFNVISIIFVFLFLDKDKKGIKEKEEEHIHKLFPILNSISKFPQIFTGHKLIIELAKIRKRKRTLRIFTLFAAIFLFNFSLYLFNTSYIPFLYSFKISYSDIFVINMLNAIGQVFIYTFFMTGKARDKLRNYYRISVFIRSISYFIVIISPLVIFDILYLNLLSYFIAGIAYALWNISASVIIYVNIAGKMEAHYIGIWSAILGVAGVTGSLMSGFLSFYSGYILTFIVSAAFVLSSVIVFNTAYKDKEKIKDFGNKV